MSESENEYDGDPDLLYPFNSRDQIPSVQNNPSESPSHDLDITNFIGLKDFMCKPNFKKACLIGRMDTQSGVFGVRMRTQKLENGGLRVFLILRKLTAAKIHKFFLGFDDLSGIDRKYSGFS